MKNMASPKNASRKQPDNNVFLQNTAIQSIGMMIVHHFVSFILIWKSFKTVHF